MVNVLTAMESVEDTVWGQFPTVTVTLQIRRKPLYYFVNLIIPCFLLSVIAVVSFVLLPGNTDRLEISTHVSVVT